MALRTPPIGSLFSLALLLVILLPLAHAFYLPGVAPQDFAPGLELQVKVNKLTSTKTQLPYEYYSLDYCSPEKTINSAENLGEVLRGDRIENSRYVFHMKEDKLCNVVCKIDKLSEKAVNSFKKKIEEEYRVNMILDNLPVAMSKPQPRVAGKIIERGWRGFPVGLKGTYTDQVLEAHAISMFPKLDTMSTSYKGTYADQVPEAHAISMFPKLDTMSTSYRLVDGITLIFYEEIGPSFD